MIRLLIISSTRNSNLEMSNDIKSYYDAKKNIEAKVISLEDFELPLFTPTREDQYKLNNDFPKNINKIKDILLNSQAIIWCSPEYNGGISPIVTNTIAWISRATVDWKESFNKKDILICSSSGGNGKSFIESFKIQLNYLGSNVMENFLIKTKKSGLDEDEFSKVLNSFYSKIVN